MLLGHGTHGSVYCDAEGNAVKIYRDFPLIPPEAFNEYLIHRLQGTGTLMHDKSSQYRIPGGVIGKWKLTMSCYGKTALDYTRPLTFRQRYDWIVAQRKDLEEALLQLHQHGWTHGDVTPNNILLKSDIDDDGIVLCDFSLSNVASEVARYGYTEGFAAPECSLQQRHYFSDWWSLGASCYYLLYRTYYTSGCKKELPHFVRQWLSDDPLQRVVDLPPILVVKEINDNCSDEGEEEEGRNNEIQQTLDMIRDQCHPVVVQLAFKILCCVADKITLELLHYPVALELSTKHLLRQSLIRDVKGDYEEFRVVEEQILELLHYRIPKV